jgi:hypothetical protein
MSSKKSLVCTMLLLTAGLVTTHEEAYAPGSGETWRWPLSLKGSASGGSLILAGTLNRNVQYVSIPTSPGESAESVAHRLADAINAHHSRQTTRVQYDPHWLWTGKRPVSASGPSLTIPLGPGGCMLGGSETGLGIPQPPLSLSCSYDEPEVSCCQADGTGGLFGCAYRYFYNDNLISSCIWSTHADNIWKYKEATIEGTNKKVITKMKHINADLDGDEGCDGYYCTKIVIYNCITGEHIGDSPYWRRDDEEPPYDIDQGEECPGH